MTDIESVLSDVERAGIDTAPLIYFVEPHSRYHRVVAPLFRQIDEGKTVGITSVITLIEVLVRPLQFRAFELERQYRHLLLNSSNFFLIPIDYSTAEQAASLRAKYSLRTPDAIQIANALTTGCQVFVTNDRHLKRVTEIPVLVLDDFVLPRSTP